MSKISEMQVLNNEDLLMLLNDCSKYLMDAYQELNDPDLWNTAQRVSFAFDYLTYRFFKESHGYTLH
jgi:hypothetical protein